MNRTSMLLARRSLLALATLPIAVVACAHDGTDTESSSSISAALQAPGVYTFEFGTPTAFASYATFAGLGYNYGIPDGSLGAINTGGTTYDFFGAGALPPCTAAGCVDEGVHPMTGAINGTATVISSTSPKATTPLFGPGAAQSAGATGWIFDNDYAGGGQVVPYFTTSTTVPAGYMMPYHGEYQYLKAEGTTCNGVPCYYAGIGLAVSHDSGASFASIGQIAQLYPPLTNYEPPNAAANVGGGYGSLVLADSFGHHLANPPPAADQATAYFYLFYPDTDPNYLANENPSLCKYYCLAVARAPYLDVIAAVSTTTTNATTAANVASLFTKYYFPTGGTESWTPGTSNAGETAWSGAFTALLPDVGGAMPSVIYDSFADEYIMAFMASDAAIETQDNTGICVRKSTDLIHWSPSTTLGNTPPCVAFFQTAPTTSGGATTYHTDLYPTLMGEGGDPLTGGSAPRVFFQNFDAYENTPTSDNFPAPWKTYSVELDSIPLYVIPPPPPIPPCHGTTCT
jgi:hypothetical protein